MPLVLLDNYFALEDPRQVRVLGTELRLSVEIGTLKLSGIIDRLEIDEAGELVVTDYKTGRAPSIAYEQARLGGVHFYAFLCEQVLGRRPARIQLLHLREPLAISTVPSDQSIRGLRQQTLAVWAAVEQACAREDFRPRPGRLCGHCAYHDYCPAFGGDLVPARRAETDDPEPGGKPSHRLRPSAGVARAVNSIRWRSPTVPIPAGVDRFDAAIDAGSTPICGAGRQSTGSCTPPAPSVITASSGWPWRPCRRLVATRTGPARSCAPRPDSASSRPWSTARSSGCSGAPGRSTWDRAPSSCASPLPAASRAGTPPRPSSGRPCCATTTGCGPLYYAIAVIVAASRIHVKIHHASDVIGGIAIGVGLGELTRHLVPVGDRGNRGARCP